jgi:hypothetical protein
MLPYLGNSGGIYSYGFVNSNGTNFEINDGILLLQEMLQCIGLYEYSKFGDRTGWAGDTDLENAANITATTNATILEFDFVPNTNKISFDYMFLSSNILGKATLELRIHRWFCFLIKKWRP